MAELDVGTEHLRRLGSIRFVLGYLWGAIRNQQRRIRLDVQLVEKDKQEIRRTFEAQRQSLSQQAADPKYVPTHSGHSSFEADSNGLPPLKYGDITTDIDSAEESNSDHPWTTIETDIISFYAGILPFMSQELLLFPAKVPGHDGTIDITLHHSDSVWKTLACLVGAETGGLFKNKDVCSFFLE
jgi:sphingosine kinase